MNPNEATLVVADEYSRMAETYDRRVTPRFESVAKAVLELLDPKPGELVLDVATGTGLLARLLAPKVHPQTVVAIDLADGALSVGSFRAGDAGIRNIRFEMMDARNIVYPGQLFDGVGSNLGMPNLGYDRTFAEVHRVLKPEGRFVFSEWAAEPSRGEAAFYAALGAHATATPSKALAEVREARRVDRGAPEAKDLLVPGRVLERLWDVGFGSAEVATRAFPVTYGNAADVIAFNAAWGWDEREVEEMDPQGRTAFEEELAGRLAPLRTRDGLRDEWTIHLYRAWK